MKMEEKRMKEKRHLQSMKRGVMRSRKKRQRDRAAKEKLKALGLWDPILRQQRGRPTVEEESYPDLAAVMERIAEPHTETDARRRTSEKSMNLDHPELLKLVQEEYDRRAESGEIKKPARPLSVSTTKRRCCMFSFLPFLV